MSIYHNEIDAACCDVLRRHLADCCVDDRSIVDVKPADLAEYKQCHFFAGIGGFSLGFRNAGVPADCNVWTGGFPCQDLSVAGKRKGLAGERSGLYFEFHRLVTGVYPRWVVLENVPGLLSSAGGKDFAIVIGGLTGLIPDVPDEGWGNAGFFRGPVYSVAYRVLDAQFFGVAQRRRRVFVVGHLGDGRAAQVLFEREGVSGDTPPRRETGARVARSLANGSVGSGYRYGQEYIVGFQERGREGGRNLEWQNDIAYALTAPNGGGRRHEMNIAYTLRAEGADASEDGTGRGGPLVIDGRNGTLQDDIATTLQACGVGEGRGSHPNATPLVAFAWQQGDDSKFNANGRGRSWVARAGDYAAGLSANRYDAIAGPGYGVRRLTPRECERLMGFPDDWTAIQSDSARYRQLGNAVAVPVAAWIARRIVAVESEAA